MLVFFKNRYYNQISWNRSASLPGDLQIESTNHLQARATVPDEEPTRTRTENEWYAVWQ